jgi:hypothetical protein
MATVVATRRPGSKPSLLDSMPPGSFGKFSTNGKGEQLHRALHEKAKGAPGAAKAVRELRGGLSHSKDAPVRSEPYLRLVAARPCKNCGRQKHSQAAHLPPDGKAIKQDDRETFPLCADAPRRKGCHPKFDQYELMPHDKAVKQGRKWARETREEIEAEGLWPKNVPKWPTKGKR